MFACIIKKVYVDKYPKCDFCAKANWNVDAKYESQVFGRDYRANMCDRHYSEHVSNEANKYILTDTE